MFSSGGPSVRFLTRYDGEVSEPLVGRQGSRVSMRVARGRASLLPSHGRGIWPRDVLKKVSRGLSRVEAENPGFPRIAQVTSRFSRVRLFVTPMDCTVRGILQARILEWVTFPFSRGIFPTQGSNSGLSHCRQIFYQLSYQGSPRILEWVAFPFSRGIFPTQGSNPGLLHCRQILYKLSHQGRPQCKESP